MLRLHGLTNLQQGQIDLQPGLFNAQNAQNVRPGQRLMNIC